MTQEWRLIQMRGGPQRSVLEERSACSGTLGGFGGATLGRRHAGPGQRQPAESTEPEELEHRPRMTTA